VVAVVEDEVGADGRQDRLASLEQGQEAPVAEVGVAVVLEGSDGGGALDPGIRDVRVDRAQLPGGAAGAQRVHHGAGGQAVVVADLERHRDGEVLAGGHQHLELRDAEQAVLLAPAVQVLDLGGVEVQAGCPAFSSRM
jgi:hypothetical protein